MAGCVPATDAEAGLYTGANVGGAAPNRRYLLDLAALDKSAQTVYQSALIASSPLVFGRSRKLIGQECADCPPGLGIGRAPEIFV